MVAISSEIVHFLVFKIFQGGGTPEPPFLIRKYVIYFSIQHCSTQGFS